MRKTILPLALALLLTLALPAFAGDTEDYRYALALMSERGEHQLAGEIFERFVRANPGHELAPRAVFYLAGCYSRQQQDASAGDAYRRMLVSYPAAPEELRTQALAYGGDAYFRAGAYEKAAQMYAQLLEKYPQNPLAETCLYWQAESYAQLAQALPQKRGELYNQAVEGFTRFFADWPESKMRAEALYSAGLSAYDARDYQRAREYLERLAREFPQDPRLQEALYHAADSCYWLEDYAAATAGFTRLIGMFADGRFVSEARAGLGWCAYAREDYAQAAREFSEAARLCKDGQKALESSFDAGVAYEMAGDSEAARSEFGKVAASAGHRRQLKALVRLGAISRAQARDLPERRAELLAQARRELEGAYALLDAGSEAELAASAAVLLGECCYDLGDYTAAAEAFSAAAVRWPQERYSPFALYQLALSLAQQKDYQKAAEAIRTLLLEYPQSELRLQAAYAMADFQQALGQVERSRLAYKWLAEEGADWARENTADPQAREKMLAQARALAARALLRLGESHYARAATEEIEQSLAAEYFRRLCAEHPQSPHIPAALLRLGEIAEKGGDFTGACGHYERALAVAESADRELSAPEAAELAQLAQVRLYAEYRRAVVRVLLAQRAQGDERRQGLEVALELVQGFIRARGGDGENARALLERIRYYRAEVLYALGRKDEAVEDYRACYQAQREGELADAALFGLGWSLHDCGQAPAGRLAFEELIERFPHSEYLPEARLLLAAQKRAEGQAQEAVEQARLILEVAKFSAFHARALIEKCAALGELGRHEEAARELEEQISGGSGGADMPKLLYALSWTYWAQAEPRLKQAAELEKEYQALLAGAQLQSLPGEKRSQAEAARERWRRELAAAREQEDKMARVLERVLRDYPDFPALAEVNLRLGEVAYDRGEYPKALERYRQVLQGDGAALADKARYRIAWCNLRLSREGGAQEPAQMRREALLAFMQVCNDSPQSPLAAECAWRAAEIMREDGEFARALNLYEKAMAAQTAEIARGAEYGRALCLLEMQEYSRALNAFKDYLRGNAGGVLTHEANWGAGFAALNLGANIEAQEFFTAARAGDYGGEAAAKARYGLGLIALEQQDYRAAREEFRKVDVFHSQWQEVAALSLIKAAEASRQMGEHAAAARDLQRIISHYSGSPHAAQARAMLGAEQDGKN